MKKILILEANPHADLALNDEIQDLQDAIQESHDREEFQISIGLSIRSTQLQKRILNYKPNIVHFCGHGTGQDGLVFRDKKIDTDALSNLFKLFHEHHLECVVLNACYTEAQAQEIAKHIKYVIGMNQAIRDDAAIAFSIGFYSALGFGRSFEDAFEFGKNAIQLAIANGSIDRNAMKQEIRKLEPLEPLDRVTEINIPEHLKPVLHKKEDHSSHFRIRIAIVAMTREEAEQLDTGQVFGEHEEETEDFTQFRELKEALGIEELALQYGLSRDAWQPLGIKQKTIKEIIQNLVEKKINPNRLPDKEKVFIDYVSNLLIPQNNEFSISVWATNVRRDKKRELFAIVNREQS